MLPRLIAGENFKRTHWSGRYIYYVNTKVVAAIKMKDNDKNYYAEFSQNDILAKDWMVVV